MRAPYRIEPVAPAAVAGATGVHHTVEGEVGALLLSASVALTASATVATRYAALELRTQQGDLVYRVPSAEAIVATETWEVVAAVDAEPIDHAAEKTIVLRVPDVPLLPGWVVSLGFLAPAAGDSVAAGLFVMAFGPATLRELRDDEYADHGVHLAGPHAFGRH